MNLLALAILAILAAFLVSLIIYLYRRYSVPAPGFSLVTDGHQWSFRYPGSGRICIYPLSSHQEAINLTWRRYKEAQREIKPKEINWKDAE